MNFDILRQKILEKAIRGELVPQLESEPEVNQVGDPPENVSFSIPEKWKWIHFSEAIETVSTKLFQIKSKEVLDKGLYPVVSQSKEILDGYSDNKNKLIPESKLPIILFGDHTRVLKYIDYRFIVGADGTKLLRIKNPALYPKYVYMALKWIINLTRERGYSRHFQFIKCVYLPCPPLEEQQRIIEKTKQLFDQINQAEKAYNELSGPLSERFRQLCLEKAIQGKLVPQLESEPEMAQIGETPEDVAFDIPAKWKWMSLENVLTEISDGSHNPPPNSGKGIPVLSAKNVNNGIIDAQLITRWTTEEQWAIEDKKIHIEPGDVLLTIVGTIGRTAVVSNDMPKFILQRSVCVMKTKNFLNSEFLSLMLTSPALLEWMMDRASGTAQKGIYLKSLRKMPYLFHHFLNSIALSAKF